MDSFHDSFGYIRQRFPLPLCLGNKTGNIKINHMVLIQVRQIPLRSRYFLVIKELMGIAGTVIVCTQHLCRIGLSKTPWPADTGQHFHCPYSLIDQFDQTGLIHIFRLQDFPKSFIPRIQIGSHCNHLRK